MKTVVVIIGDNGTSNGGKSSWYDFNLDGLTNEDDRLIIEQNFGKKCQATGL